MDEHDWIITIMEQRLHTAQRHMLRAMCAERFPQTGDATWVDWIQQATHAAEQAAKDAGVQMWVAAQRKLKFRWAGKVARLTDDRWTQLCLHWTPEAGERRVGRPAARW